MEARSTVLLCVSGSISAYRAADVARDLMEKGCNVQVALTEGALKFVTADLFTWLTERPAFTDTFQQTEPGQMAHIELAREASLFVCAPASAHTLAKFANGYAGDAVSSLFLAYRGPVLLAPAMNPAMWLHPATVANVRLLQARGTHFVQPDYGLVACGEEGIGKLAGVEQIVHAALSLLHDWVSYRGKHIVITSGPTYEPIDPVRFIGNRSSGKMGHALAHAALLRGARVTLITGPTSLPEPIGADVISVRTAAEMARATEEVFPQCDVFIGAAAVADFRPVLEADRKIKRRPEGLTLGLEPTEDIIASLTAMKKPGQKIVGFAAETEALVENAKAKMAAKGLDFIIANDVTAPDAGFDSDNNRVTIIRQEGIAIEVPLMTKLQLGDHILEFIARG